MVWRMTTLVAGVLALQGCAAGSIAGAALQLAGLQKPPAIPEAQQPPRTVALRLHAALNLNSGAGAPPLAVVARIYKLRQGAAFQQMPYASFLDTQREREQLGADLLEVKEVTLIPGQRYEISDQVAREAGVIGVVALFRAPSGRRWRLTFAAADAERAGITIGLQGCALTVGGGAAAIDAPPATTAGCL